MRYPNTEAEIATVLAAALGAGIAIGWLLRGRSRTFVRAVGQKKLNKSEVDLTDSGMMAETGEYKMVIVVRTDLKMGKGKVAAQCAHAAVSAVSKLSYSNPALLDIWKQYGQPKVVVKTDNQESLVQLAQKARSLGLTASIICDAGRTQIPTGSKTVLGVGPGPASLVDEVTGHLKLC